MAAFQPTAPARPTTAPEAPARGNAAVHPTNGGANPLPLGEQSSTPATPKNQITSDRKTWHDVRDPESGMVSEQYLLPAAWTVSAQGWKHPNGATVHGGPNQNHLLPQAPYRDLQQLIQQEIIPELRRSGMQVEGTENLPQLARREDQRLSYTWQQYPMQVTNQAAGISFSQGTTRGMLIVYFAVGRGQMGGYVGYWSHVLRAPAGVFAQAKADVLYALAHSRQPEAFIAYFNQKSKNRAYGSAARHQAKMQQREQAFAAHQRSQSTLSEIGDIYHKTYQNTSAMRDAGQQKTIDMIREETPRTNPYTGQTNRVSQNYRYYFVNPQGQWIGTNNANYDPNLDPNYNQQSWRSAPAPSGNH